MNQNHSGTRNAQPSRRELMHALLARKAAMEGKSFGKRETG